MNRCSIIRLSAIIGLGLAILPRPAVSQQKSLKEQLVGTWTIVSSVQTHKDGTKIDGNGANPKGLFILTSDGHYSFMISRSDIPKFASNERDQGTADEYKAVVQGVTAYIGTWSVDEASKTPDDEHRGRVVSQFRWEQSEANHHLA